MISSGSQTDVELLEYYGRLINPTYPSFLMKFGIDRPATYATGATITDSAGKVYVDCVGGYGLYSLGHNHPKIVAALVDQLKSQQLVTRPFITEVSVKLARYLSAVLPEGLECLFVCNSGSEAIDSAMKLARLHSGRKELIAAKKSFHGFTFGALSASGIPSFRHSFEPLVPAIIHVPFGDLEALKSAITENTAAVLLEPIQHEAGVFVPPRTYFQEVRKICDSEGVMLILDEIKTGFGKTGEMFACEYFGIIPDVLVVGKSLGGGFIPIGGIIAKRKLWKKFGLSFTMSASSFAGNALACRAALATIEVLKEERLVDKCKEKGSFMLQRLAELKGKYSQIIKAVTGIGLLIGVQFFKSAETFEFAREMIRQGILVLPAFGNPSVLILEPPFVIPMDQLHRVVECFHSACRKLAR